MNEAHSAFAGAVSTADADPLAHPTLPPPANWPGVIIIVILIGFFGTAAVLGPIVRMTMRDEAVGDVDVDDGDDD